MEIGWVFILVKRNISKNVFLSNVVQPLPLCYKFDTKDTVGNCVPVLEPLIFIDELVDW